MSEPSLDISLLVCTYNRSQDLRELLETAVKQETNGEFSYEVIVVDNNSTDKTRDTVKEFIDAGHSNVQYFFEPRQGKSYALNTALEAAKGWAYVITDDDFILPANWLHEIHQAFRDHPEAAVISGKVLPRWQGEAPAWLTKDHWSAIAMADYGDKPFYAGDDNPICLLAGAFRRDAVQEVGGYRADLGVSPDQIGGVEDLDILQRLWGAGHKALYQPQIAFEHKVGANRLTKAYHRRWHKGHGRFYAAMRDERIEASIGHLLGVPAHLYRQAARDVLGWLKCSLLRRKAEAFVHETRLCFFYGFLSKRREDVLLQDSSTVLGSGQYRPR
ncbi:MAG TPA: glycosyltransferase [Pyrinomonadaceae bacterium]|nr:glycosyltransferase [Pyrinomonadaceae bacterium]